MFPKREKIGGKLPSFVRSIRRNCRSSLCSVANKRKCVEMYDEQPAAGEIFTAYKKIEPCSNADVWPKGRSGHRMCSDDNFLYVYGGFNPNDTNKTYNDLWRYNISTNKWLQLPDNESLAPKPCASSSMLLWKNNIFIFGGTGFPFAANNSNDLFMYSLKRLKWIDLSKLSCDKKISSERTAKVKNETCGCYSITDSAPIPKYGQSMVISPDQYIYVYSGTTGQLFSSELHAFCLRKLIWTEYKLCDKHLLHQPIPRYRHEAVAYGDEFYVLGGSTLDQYFEFDNIQSFNCKKKTWKTVRCKSAEKRNNAVLLPDSRKAHSCVRYNDNIYMLAGVTFLRGSLSDCWRFNIGTSTWHKLKEPFPYPVLFHSASLTTDGCMYIFGGVNQEGKRVADLHRIWLDVPRLKQQAWKKVVKLLRATNSLNQETLKKLGIPRCFAYLIDDTV